MCVGSMLCDLAVRDWRGMGGEVGVSLSSTSESEVIPPNMMAHVLTDMKRLDAREPE